MSKVFQFKQFSVAQDRTAMKIGTDGVLLGAWAPIDYEPQSILDIGTGTGIIALMLAQRSEVSMVDALELDDNAYEQAAENFENSPWNDRLLCYHAHLYEFVTEIEDQYDLIVCNPPYFETGSPTSSSSRDQARYEEAMPFELLVAAADRLLSPRGVFSVVLPIDRTDRFIKLASQGGLFPFKITDVKGTPKKNPKRSLITFSKRECELNRENLVIEHARHEYTEEYKDLTGDFYLKM